MKREKERREKDGGVGGCAGGFSGWLMCSLIKRFLWVYD